jgi:putative tryptophan/tyrosine transport system substrate-binding protein
LDRRRVIFALVATSGCLTLARAHGQTQKTSSVGVLSGNDRYLPDFDAFREGLSQLGYVEGKTLSIHWRFAEKGAPQLPALARELITLKPDVLVGTSTPAVNALRPVAGNIPIIFTNIGDPVSTGFVASLARPGGNMTGQSILAPELSAKRLGLIKEIVVGTSTIAVVWNSSNPANQLQYRQIDQAAPALGIRLIPLPVQKKEDIPVAVDAAAKKRADALLVLPDPVTGSHRSELIELVGRARMPAMYGYREFPDAGGLISYGPNLRAMYRRTAVYVDKILKGAKPSDLPVELPATFELVVNLRTAKTLGLAIPQSLLLRADRVIE